MYHIKNLLAGQKNSLNCGTTKDFQPQNPNAVANHYATILRNELIALYPYCGNYFTLICYWFKFITDIYLGSDDDRIKQLCIDLVLEIYKAADRTTSIEAYDNRLNDYIAKNIILKCFKKHSYFEKGVNYQHLLDSRKLPFAGIDRQILRNLLFSVPHGDLTVNGFFSSAFLDNLFLSKKIAIETLINAKLLIIIEIFQWLKTFVRIIIISRKQCVISADKNLDQLCKYSFSKSRETNYHLIYAIYSLRFGNVFGELLDFEDLALLIDMVNRNHESLTENDDILLPVEKDITNFINKTKVDGMYVFPLVVKSMPYFIENTDWDNAINKKYGQINRRIAFRLTYRAIRERIIPFLSLEDIIATCLTCYDLHRLFDNYNQ